MFEAVLRRQGWIIAVGLCFLAATAWWYTLDIAARMSVSMASLGAHRMVLGPTDVLITFIMWTLMMVAMMLPAATPAALIHAAARRQQQSRSVLTPTGLFVLGYLAAWTLFSVLHGRCTTWPC
jgi:predicted metal-binding membrane protein